MPGSMGQEAGSDYVRMRPMRGGDSPQSYNQNSHYQANVYRLTSPLLLKAVESYSKGRARECGAGSARIVDLGCSTGKNSITMVNAMFDQIRLHWGPATEVSVFFSDLPGNDFNSLFELLESQSQAVKSAYFAAAVPGSFYAQLFPTRSLDIVTCLNSLHWLSRDPCPSPNARPSWNPGTVWYGRSQSPDVQAAFKALAKSDLVTFLSCRAREMVPGGLLFVVCSASGVSGPDLDESGKIKGRWWIDLLDDSWSELVQEGVASPASLDNFNLPTYQRSLAEIQEGIEAAGNEFEVEALKIQEVPVPQPGIGSAELEAMAVRIVNVCRAVTDSMVEAAEGKEFVKMLGEKMMSITLRQLLAPDWLEKAKGNFGVALLRRTATVIQ